MSTAMAQITFDLGAPTEDLQMFDADQLQPWPGLNPRQHFDPEEMEKLEASIAEHGVLQNIVVHDTGDDVKWIVAGESRWRCAKAAGVRIPARVRTFTESQALHLALLENLQRNSLLPREEGRGFKRALELESDLTQEQLGARYGRDQSYVSNRIRLLDMPDAVGGLVDRGVIAPTFARDHLLRWIGEEKADDLYGTLVSMITTRPDPDEPVTRAWLVQIVEQLTQMLGTKQQAAPLKKDAGKKSTKAPAKKPATKGKVEKPAAAAEPEAPSAEPDPPTQAESDAPSLPEDAGDQSAVTDGDVAPAAAEAEPNDVTTDVLPDVGEPEVGETADAEPATGPAEDAVASASEADAASTRGNEADADEQLEDDGDVIIGVITALEPLMEEYSATIQLVRPSARSNELLATITPSRKKGKTSVSPLTLRGLATDIDRRIQESVRIYVDGIMAEE